MAFIDNGVEMVKGKALLAKRVWYFIQATDAPVGSKATLPSMTTEGGTTFGGDSIDEQTKVGRVVMASTNEDSIELTTYVVAGDDSIDIIADAKSEGKQVKVWRVVVDEAFAKKELDDDQVEHTVYPAHFGYGLVDELELSDGDDLVEASYTLNILGKLQKGTFPLNDEQVAALAELYEFERPGETTGEFGAQAE